MGVPTSEVGYTPAMLRREDHEAHKGHVVALEKKNIYILRCTALLMSKHVIICNSSRSFYYASHPTTDIIEGVFTFKKSCRFTVHVLIEFIYARKKRTVFPKPIIRKITNSHQQFVQTPFSEFHTNRTIHMKTTQTHSFTSLRKRG